MHLHVPDVIKLVIVILFSLNYGCKWFIRVKLLVEPNNIFCWEYRRMMKSSRVSVTYMIVSTFRGIQGTCPPPPAGIQAKRGIRKINNKKKGWKRGRAWKDDDQDDEKKTLFFIFNNTKNIKNCMYLYNLLRMIEI